MGVVIPEVRLRVTVEHRLARGAIGGSLRPALAEGLLAQSGPGDLVDTAVLLVQGPAGRWCGASCRPSRPVTDAFSLAGGEICSS